MRVADKHTEACPNLIVWYAGQDLDGENGY